MIPVEPRPELAGFDASVRQPGLEWIGEAGLDAEQPVPPRTKLEGLSYNYVTSAMRADGSEAILKVGFPTRELSMEIEALRFFDGRGAVRLLAASGGRGALLLERLRPGEPLRTSGEEGAEEAIGVSAGVMRRLWRPAPPGTESRPVGDWVVGMVERAPDLLAAHPRFPGHWIGRSVALYEDLAEALPEALVLHGDLHPGNILSAEREPWLAIDAWGVVGEPAWEVGPFLLNILPPPGAPECGRLVERWVGQFAEELGLDRCRLRDCSVVRAVLSAFWMLEDHGRGWETPLAYAEMLAELAV